MELAPSPGTEACSEHLQAIRLAVARRQGEHFFLAWLAQNPWDAEKSVGTFAAGFKRSRSCRKAINSGSCLVSRVGGMSRRGPDLPVLLLLVQGLCVPSWRHRQGQRLRHLARTAPRGDRILTASVVAFHDEVVLASCRSLGALGVYFVFQLCRTCVA